MSYVFNILIGIDQLGNTLAGGNPDNTISGRTGYFSKYANTTVRWYWNILKIIINFTFYPLDGPDHCDQAYHKEELEEYYELKGIAYFILSLIIIASCLLIIPILYLLLLIQVLTGKQTKYDNF